MDRKPDAPDWRGALGTYLAVIAAGNLTWEALQTPLYTIWRNGSRAEIAFAVLHCTAGDIVIALTALVLALLLVGERAWPVRDFGRVLGFTLLFGLGYTVFSGVAESQPTGMGIF